jgi:hypothetical protein
VRINGTSIGKLKDRSDLQHGGLETHVIAIDIPTFKALVGPDKRFDMSIVLERQSAHPGWADDFMLTRIDTLDVVVRAGQE